ncbi:Uncharacterized protein DAT39_000146 [Clarias magur]|uniref:Uncharacterized protein n=1 Tax=Clarias magur TaxID=1594786 RepID=A0A8J4XHJ9_CLAMG|nr:Uncharacterized protein DAT39_000146 [Clarias magur]
MNLPYTHCLALAVETDIREKPEDPLTAEHLSRRMLRSLTRGTSGDAVAWLSVQCGPCGDPQHRCSLAGKAELSWTAGSQDGAWQTWATRPKWASPSRLHGYQK